MDEHEQLTRKQGSFLSTTLRWQDNTRYNKIKITDDLSPIANLFQYLKYENQHFKNFGLRSPYYQQYTLAVMKLGFKDDRLLYIFAVK